MQPACGWSRWGLAALVCLNECTFRGRVLIRPESNSADSTDLVSFWDIMFAVMARFEADPAPLAAATGCAKNSFPTQFLGPSTLLENLSDMRTGSAMKTIMNKAEQHPCPGCASPRQRIGWPTSHPIVHLNWVPGDPPMKCAWVYLCARVFPEWDMTSA